MNKNSILKPGSMLHNFIYLLWQFNYCLLALKPVRQKSFTEWILKIYLSKQVIKLVINIYIRKPIEYLLHLLGNKVYLLPKDTNINENDLFIIHYLFIKDKIYHAYQFRNKYLYILLFNPYSGSLHGILKSDKKSNKKKFYFKL